MQENFCHFYQRIFLHHILWRHLSPEDTVFKSVPVSGNFSSGFWFKSSVNSSCSSFESWQNFYSFILSLVYIFLSHIELIFLSFLLLIVFFFMARKFHYSIWNFRCFIQFLIQDWMNVCYDKTVHGFIYSC